MAAVAALVPNRVLAATASAFNGGRSQVNFNFLLNGGDFPFLNCLKMAQAWAYLDNSGPAEPSIFDTDGYPTRITNGGVYTVFFVPSQAVRPGKYIATWSGNGTIHFGMQNTAVSGSKSSYTGAGRYVFTTTDDRFVFGISSVGSTHITNVKIFHEADETAVKAGEVFGTKFKQRLQQSNFGVIRFLNWQQGNTTNVTTWTTRRPVTFAYYAGSEFRASIYAGTTTNSGAAYSATLPGFRLVDKAMVTVRFNASATGPCTLNINRTGAINILSQYAAPLESWAYPIGNSWQSIATLVYDAKLNGWIKSGGDISSGYQGIESGVPPEVLIQLCAEVGAHPYFVTPRLAIDPATDYMPSLAAYCKSVAPSWMVPRFEGPNETWNFSAGFLATGYARAKSQAYGWGDDVHEWYGKSVSVLGQIISSVYGNDRSRYQVLCGVQTMMGITNWGTAASNARLQSTKYVAQSEPAQSPFTNSPASKWVTHVAVANYYTPSFYNTPDELNLAASLQKAANDAKSQAEILNSYASTANSGNGDFTLSKVLTCHTNWKAWAITNGVKSMCGYEGGYSPDYGNDTTINKLRSASKGASSLYSLTMTNYNNFASLSGSGFTTEFPSCFELSAAAGGGSAWSVLDDIYQSPNPPQWTAIMDYNKVSVPAASTNVLKQLKPLYNTVK